ncbi:MAG: DJ-1/PfpI family protein [Chloroflexi bacterium]|nr:DJ-1/PfpI family protein [Chloroflexota bacterium]
MHDSHSTAPIRIGMLIFPNFTQLDLTGPYAVFSRMPNTEVLLIGTTSPVRSDDGLTIVPQVQLTHAPLLDVVFVPGGAGVNQVMENQEVLDFLRIQDRHARFVTSVCTGALVLAAAGLLRGHRAATHWLSMDLLPALGVEPVYERVVVDGKYITAGGVTAGIDFGLTIVAQLLDEHIARKIQLVLEYDPHPPFDSGSPKTADPKLVEEVSQERASIQQQRRQIVERIAVKTKSKTH